MGQRLIRRIVGEIFFAGKKAQKGTALKAIVITDGSPQHGIPHLERIQHGTLCDWAFDFKYYFGFRMRQRAEMEGEDDADHTAFNLHR